MLNPCKKICMWSLPNIFTVWPWIWGSPLHAASGSAVTFSALRIMLRGRCQSANSQVSDVCDRQPPTHSKITACWEDWAMLHNLICVHVKVSFGIRLFGHFFTTSKLFLGPQNTLLIHNIMGIEINGLNLPHVQILAFYTKLRLSVFCYFWKWIYA